MYVQPQYIAWRCDNHTTHLQLTCDIWGLKLISFRSTDPGERLCNIWHRSTPSLRACARSKTAAEGHTTRWFGGRTLQSINQRPHCLHSSISFSERLSTTTQSHRVLALLHAGLRAAVRGVHEQALRSLPLPSPGCLNHSLSRLTIRQFRNRVCDRTISPSQTHVSSPVSTTWK